MPNPYPESVHRALSDTYLPPLSWSDFLAAYRINPNIIWELDANQALRVLEEIAKKALSLLPTEAPRP